MRLIDGSCNSMPFGKSVWHGKIELDRINADEKNLLDTLGLGKARKEFYAALNKKLAEQEQELNEISKCDAILRYGERPPFENYSNENPALFANPSTIEGYRTAMVNRFQAPLFSDRELSEALLKFTAAALPALKKEEGLYDQAVVNALKEANAAREDYLKKKAAYLAAFEHRAHFYNKLAEVTRNMITTVESVEGTGMAVEHHVAEYTVDPIKFLEDAAENCAAHGRVANDIANRRPDVFYRSMHPEHDV